MNVDRTPRNTNMLIWNKELWLIDHGAALYFHHAGSAWEEYALRPFTMVKDHVLLPRATQLEAANETCRALLTEQRIQNIISLLPDAWLPDGPAGAQRDMYYRFLTTRVNHSDIFVNEAKHAGKSLI